MSFKRRSKDYKKELKKTKFIPYSVRCWVKGYNQYAEVLGPKVKDDGTTNYIVRFTGSYTTHEFAAEGLILPGINLMLHEINNLYE